MSGRAQFIDVGGVQLLVLDLKNAQPDEVGPAFVEYARLMSTQAPHSVRSLIDLTDTAYDASTASLAREHAGIMDKHSYRSALIGANGLVSIAVSAYRAFSTLRGHDMQKIRAFSDREQAKAWLLEGGAPVAASA